jgi:hypothetical protein
MPTRDAYSKRYQHTQVQSLVERKIVYSHAMKASFAHLYGLEIVKGGDMPVDGDTRALYSTNLKPFDFFVW